MPSTIAVRPRDLVSPPLLYGTAWKEERTESLVLQALQAGFRGLDTANQRKHYFEAAVGQALAIAEQRGIVRREQVFLQTKFTFRAGQDQRLPYDSAARVADQVRQSFVSSLEHLRTDYLDSYLLHGPSRRNGLGPEDLEAWHAIEQLRASGKARYIGVSNVSVEQLRLLAEQSHILPSFVQNRCYAATGWDRECRAYCEQTGIVYQGFSLLTANRRELQRPIVARIAKRLRVTPAQVVFAFAQRVGMLPLTGTTNPLHMKQDLESTELLFEPADLAALSELDTPTSA
ncbi:MAG TPA: aldo/keto reductase [Polyangiaceae bacterium]|nr:aldo/keto reductase [Polyangiaceae bacterium]